ncbi:hypothetical protein CL628_02620 [bacterium]|nr:hypothetical protein [bacterium]
MQRNMAALETALVDRLQDRGHSAQDMLERLGPRCRWAFIGDVQGALDNLCQAKRARTTGTGDKKYHRPAKEDRVRQKPIQIPPDVLLAALDISSPRTAAVVLGLLPAAYSDAKPARVGTLLNNMLQQGTHGVETAKDGTSRVYWKAPF